MILDFLNQTIDGAAVPVMPSQRVIDCATGETLRDVMLLDTVAGTAETFIREQAAPGVSGYVLDPRTNVERRRRVKGVVVMWQTKGATT
jgi:hypothetical protein